MDEQSKSEIEILAWALKDLGEFKYHSDAVMKLLARDVLERLAAGGYKVTITG